MRKLALRPWFDSSLEALGALSNLFQCRFKSSQLFRARIGKDSPNFGGVFPKNRSNQSSAFCCERYDADATVFWTLDAAYHAPFDQAVHGRTDRTGGQKHFWADRIHRQRPFVQKSLKDPEIGVVDSSLR